MESAGQTCLSQPRNPLRLTTSPSPPASLLQPPDAFQYTFQMALPLLGDTTCLEVCTSCALPEAVYGLGAFFVFVNDTCSPASMAAQWRVLTTPQMDHIRLQNVPTGTCLAVDNSTKLLAYAGM